ncbi:MAG: hypothetical protein P5690_16725, partial [Limnospira sp. PMC 1236.20]|nr:hypothetical protein [Limnospira sp. PMC 1236.20]MDT9317288.1 hypothetical protein [Limnospira sp. PMC 1306.21]
MVCVRVVLVFPIGGLAPAAWWRVFCAVCGVHGLRRIVVGGVFKVDLWELWLIAEPARAGFQSLPAGIMADCGTRKGGFSK